MDIALALEGIWWRYPTFSEKPNTWMLKNASLQVKRGECLGITGPSGAGKTTLCRTMSGIIPSTARLTPEQLPHHFRGSVPVLGKDISTTPTDAQQIGMVLQDPENQFLRMSLLHELGVGLQFQGLPREEITRRAEEALRWVGLEHLWPGAFYRHPSELSGGQKQRVALASFLALRPQILILDEPTSDLDPIGKREVIETIARLRQEHAMSIVLVEQDPDILSAFCDRIVLLNEGRVEFIAPPADFYAERELLERCGVSVSELTHISWQTGYLYKSRPPLTIEEAEQAFVVGARLIAPTVVVVCNVGDVDHGDDERGGRHECGPYDDGATARTGEERRNIVVCAQDVHYRYEDGTPALSGVDLTLQQGEMLALLGPNGSGKTTFAKILAGILRPTSGRVQVLGQDIAVRKVRKLLPSRVGYVFQNPDHQIFQQTVRAEIEYGLKNLGVAVLQRQKRALETLALVDLTQYAEENPLFLSKGQRQRLAVAALIAMGPEILIVDEPTTGQDARSTAALMQMLCQLQQQGKTVLVITHDMALVAEYCQRVVAFQQGKLSFTGTPEELFGNSEVLRRTGLRAPAAATLAMQVRKKHPSFPPLLTVQQWVDMLGVNSVSYS